MPEKQHTYFSIGLLAILVFVSLLLRDIDDKPKKPIASQDNARTSTSYFFPMTSVTDIAIPKTANQRPQLPDSILSSHRHFNIHYTTEGENAIAITDSNTNNIPDRIEIIADAFEQSYAVEIEHMNYKLPPSFQNGTKPYDIYVLDLNNSFGITVAESMDSTAWEQKNVSSYILFDNDFIGSGFHIQGEPAIKSTAAHEFFHAIQLGYVFRKFDSFFFELTAVWIEDHVFDEVDNYLYFMDYFFSAPDIPLNGVSFTVPTIFKHIYGSCIFGFYIEENFGWDAIRQIWHMMPDKSALTAANDLFRTFGSNFENEFIKFSIWNFFTGSRARSKYYSNGSNYPEIFLQDEKNFSYFSEQTGEGYHLTAGYFLFHSEKGGDFKTRMITDSTHHWKLIALYGDEKNIRKAIVNPGHTLEINEVPDNQDIVLIPCNIDRFTQPEHVYFKDKPEKYTLYLSKEVVRNYPNQKTFAVEKIYPNPFCTHVNFSIRKIHEAPVSIEVFNTVGQRVFRGDFELTEDLNQLSWQAISNNKSLPAGLYLAKFSSGNFQQIEKIILCH